MRIPLLRFGALLAILALILSACGGQGASPAAEGSEPAATEEEGGGETGEVVEIRWFCCARERRGCWG